MLKVNEQEEDGDGPKEAQQEEVEKRSEAHVDADDACQKEKSDKLWASFLSDVGSRPKDCTAGIQVLNIYFKIMHSSMAEAKKSPKQRLISR